MVAFHLLQVALLVRIQTPQPEVFTSLICFAVKGGGEVKNKQRCLLKRFATLVAALLMTCCLTVPALASNNWPASPSYDDFIAHHGSWYVWQSYSFDGSLGYELICHPFIENSGTNTLSTSFVPYNTDARTYSYTDGTTTTTLLCAIPYIPYGASGYWSELPSFPVGSGSSLSHCAYVRVYPVTRDGALSSIDDVFSDTSIRCYLTSAFSSSDSSFAATTDGAILDDFPVFVPNSVFVAGSKSDTSTNHTSFSLEDGATNFWASPFNYRVVTLSSSHTSSHSMLPFAQNATIPSSELGFCFFKHPGSGYHAYASSFNVSNLFFAASLWVPATMLPSDVKVGDWISHGTMDKLQDQLVNDFDVNSDTLKDTKQNFDSWQNSNTIDTDVADTSLDIINGLMQNVGQFVFVVSLLCFGAVVLRVLIRKAVEG